MLVNLTIGVVAASFDYSKYVDIIYGSHVKIVATAGVNQEQFIEKFNACGIKVTSEYVVARHALKAKHIGATEVRIDGFECAGHPDESDIPSLVLIPKAVAASICGNKEVYGSLP